MLLPYEMEDGMDYNTYLLERIEAHLWTAAMASIGQVSKVRLTASEIGEAKRAKKAHGAEMDRIDDRYRREPRT